MHNKGRGEAAGLSSRQKTRQQHLRISQSETDYQKSIRLQDLIKCLIGSIS